MLISFNGTNDGWGNYVINGTRKKRRNHKKIKVLRGDIQLGDIITNFPNYRQNAYSIILSFKGKPDLEIMDKALSDFEKLFMHGFERYEYHFDAVLHLDTDDSHIHVRIPKFNLYTRTQLQLYLDKKDRYRVNFIRNILDMKYKLESPQNNRQLIKEEQDFHIDTWSERHKEEKIDFSEPISRKKYRLEINNVVKELHQAGLIENVDDIKQFLENLELEVINEGDDYSKDFYYITIKNESGKIRLIGDIYNEKFWKYSRENRRKQISDNKQYRGSYESNEQEYNRVLHELKIALTKRTGEIEKRYAASRKRAFARLNNLQQQDKKSLENKTKFIQSKRVTTTQTNFATNSIINNRNIFNELSDIHTKTSKQMADSKQIQARTKRWQVYDYTLERFYLLKENTTLLLQTGGLNGAINKNITEKNSKTGTKRDSTHRLTQSGQEALYRKAQLSMQRMGQTRVYRERYRKKIDTIGEQCKEIEQQFNSNISTINKIIRDITKGTSDSGVKINNNRDVTTFDYVDELLEWGRQPF